jgi:hypothetical protein
MQHTLRILLKDFSDLCPARFRRNKKRPALLLPGASGWPVLTWKSKLCTSRHRCALKVTANRHAWLVVQRDGVNVVVDLLTVRVSQSRKASQVVMQFESDIVERSSDRGAYSVMGVPP